MPFLDRTSELTSIIETKIQQQQYEGKLKGSKTRQKKHNKEDNQVKQFYSQAQKVSHDLCHTAEVLGKLTQLVKKRTPFDDNVDNIQHLTAKVKEQLATAEFALRELNENIRSQSNTDNQAEKQSSEHSNHIVTGLKSRLMYATQQFQTVLQTRTTQIKQKQERRNMFTYNKPNFNRHMQNGNGELTINIHDPSSMGDHSAANGGLLQQQVQPDTTVQIHRNDNYLKMRSDEVKALERDMVQLSEMFIELGTMVKLQGELAERIDDRVSHAVVNIEEGHNELLKYFRRISSNRGLILKMLFVMIVFVIFIGVFVIG